MQIKKKNFDAVIMATPATTTTTAPQSSWNYGTAPYTNKTNRGQKGFRVGFLHNLLFWLGSITWLIGSALMVASQGRYNLNPSPLSVFPTFDGANFVGAYVCFIIGSALWVIASLVHISTVYGEVAIFRNVLGVTATPLLGRYLIFGVWMELLGVILLLIGSAVFAGHTPDTTSTGAIIWMIGFGFWFFGEAQALMVALATISMAALMPDMGLRYRAWHGQQATLANFVALLFFVLGSILFITQQPPGSYLVGGLLWLFGAIVQSLAYWMHMSTVWAVYVPILPYLLAGTAVTALAAGGAGAAAAKGPDGTTYAREQKANAVGAPTTTTATAPVAAGAPVATTAPAPAAQAAV